MFLFGLAKSEKFEKENVGVIVLILASKSRKNMEYQVCEKLLFSLNHILCFFAIVRHVECEIDRNCPFLVLFQFVEETVSIGYSDDRKSDQISQNDLDLILYSIDDHCRSFSHFIDFKSCSKFYDPIDKIRALIIDRTNMDF